mgnify:CR=1 FL=1
MDKQNNSNLDALLNNLIENFGEDDPVTQKVESLMEEKVNLLLVGATGSGKSSTINALFDTQVAEVGTGVDPETASIDCYALDNFCIWDTPGLGDGVENDIAIAKAIKAKLSETDPEGAQVVDMVLIVLDASTKDLGTVYTLLNVDRGVPEVWGSVYDIRDLLDATVKLRDGKKITDMEMNVVQKLALKEALKKLEGTEIEKLLKEYNVI